MLTGPGAAVEVFPPLLSMVSQPSPVLVWTLAWKRTELVEEVKTVTVCGGAEAPAIALKMRPEGLGAATAGVVSGRSLNAMGKSRGELFAPAAVMRMMPS